MSIVDPTLVDPATIAVHSQADRPYTPDVFYRLLMLAMLIGDVFWWRRADRRLRDARYMRIWRTALSLYTLTQLGYMLRILFSPYTRWHNPRSLNELGMMSAYIWHLLILPATLVAMGGRAILAEVGRALSPARIANPADAPALASRRNVLAAAAIAIPPLITGSMVGVSVWERGRFRVRRMDVHLKDLPASLDGMTIAQVSDTHIGRFTNDDMLRHVADTANALEADLLLFAGDLIDVSLGDLGTGIQFARKLKARYGVFFCEGNHDLIQDATNETTFFETRTKAAGLSILFDESRFVEVRGHPVQIIGARWQRRETDRLARARSLMRTISPDAFPIFLTHHPHAWDEARTPLTLAGHTHGGQLMLNERIGAGPILFRYWSGLYQANGRALIVSNGVGNWFPLRTHAPAEINHLRLIRSV